MYWDNRFIRMTDGYIHLKEVCYDDDGGLMGYCEPFLLDDEPDWPRVFAGRVSVAATRPVLDEGDFPIPVVR